MNVLREMIEILETKLELDNRSSGGNYRSMNTAKQIQENTTRVPLSGHVSQETAYVVDDYPYGRTVRTQIRYWVEFKPNKGFRWVSQTVNPKTGRWNKEKASTYSMVAGCMYLDHQKHVQFAQLSEYSSATEALDFVRDFGNSADTTMLKKWVPAKIKHLKATIDGTIVWKINGEPQPESPAAQERNQKELADWEAVALLLK